MIDYIKGQIIELTPTELILENAGIGYSILISLQTYEAFQQQTQAVAYIHHYIREDEELYFGFATKDERELFRLLISVSGIGVASARMMSYTINYLDSSCCSEGQIYANISGNASLTLGFEISRSGFSTKSRWAMSGWGT